MITGLNIPWFFNQFRNGNYYTPFSVIEKIRALNPGVLRYPGGTIANYYDSTKPGYGYEQTQATENYLSRFEDLLIRLDMNVSVCYVANVYNALIQPDRVQYWIDNTMNALRKLPQTTHVELGNEICISGVYMQIADKPGLFESTTKYQAKVAAKAYNYLEVAHKFRNAIKSELPNVRISLPMQPPFTVRNNEWNRVLRTYGLNDCETQHIYLTTRAYLETKREVEKILAGSVKPVLVTEWSWNHGNSDDAPKNLSDVGTLYYKAFFKDFPEVCRLDKRVEMICRHQLYSNTVYGVIKP